MKKKKVLYALALLLIIVIPFTVVFGKKTGLNFNFLSKLKGSPAQVVSGTYTYNNKSFPVKDIWGSSEIPKFYLGPYEHYGTLKSQYIHEAKTSDGKYYHAYCIDRGISIEDTNSPSLDAYVYDGNFEGLTSRDINGNVSSTLTDEQIETLQDILASGYHYSEDHTVSIDKINDATVKKKIFVKQILVWEIMAGGRYNLEEIPSCCDDYGSSTPLNCSYNAVIAQRSDLLQYYREALQAAREYRSKRNGENIYSPALGKNYTMRWDSKQQKYTTGVISNALGGYTSNCQAINNNDITISISGDHATVTSTKPIQSATISCDYVEGSGTSTWWYYDFPSHPSWQRIVNGDGGATINGRFTVGTEEAQIFISKYNPEGSRLSGSKFTLTLKNDSSVKFNLTGNDGKVSLERSGIYILTETDTPFGYEKIRQTELNIDLNTRSISSSNTGEVQASFNDTEHAFEIRVVDNYKAFNISKINENNEALKGATFKIYNGSNFNNEVKFTKSNNIFSYSTSGNVTEIVDNNYSTYTIRFLEKGIYKVVETKAPSPYVLTSKIEDRTYYIKVADEYNIYDCKSDSTCKNASLTVSNTLKFKNYFTKLNIIKTGQGGLPLAGVKFILLNEAKDTYYKATLSNGTYNYSGTSTNISDATVLITNASGQINVNSLPVGTYYIKEIETIDPYVLPDGDDAYTKLVVDMKSDGPTVNNKASCSEGISNATKEFNFYKVDENGNYLSGGKFKIQKFNDDTGKYEDIKLVSVENNGQYQAKANVFKEDEENGKVQFTLSHGIATFVDMTPGTTYRILEIEAPKGYELANVDNSAVIKLDRKGYAKGSATIINQTKKLEGSTAQAELIIEIQTGRKLIRYGLIIAGTLIIIAGLMVTLIYVSKKRK
ncbi:MAG: hypothetical protein IKZ96_03055 [Bacilli bacterium]|nr:hypothetical protein [Bacilli bacterium]